METRSSDVKTMPRLLTAKNGFVLHISPYAGVKKITLAKTAGPHLVYGISYTHPERMPMMLSN
ncbi:MAG: hypothetical protein HOP18_04385 [Deltaproteobacteria bacterium]|jgi:hypothetical protein|nr:hypothetical protein [Deltaproteobacteria bacterium]